MPFFRVLLVHKHFLWSIGSKIRTTKSHTFSREDWRLYWDTCIIYTHSLIPDLKGDCQHFIELRYLPCKNVINYDKAVNSLPQSCRLGLNVVTKSSTQEEVAIFLFNARVYPPHPQSNGNGWTHQREETKPGSYGVSGIHQKAYLVLAHSQNSKYLCNSEMHFQSLIEKSDFSTTNVDLAILCTSRYLPIRWLSVAFFVAWHCIFSDWMHYIFLPEKHNSSPSYHIVTMTHCRHNASGTAQDQPCCVFVCLF